MRDTEKRIKIRERVAVAAHGSGTFRVDDPNRSEGVKQNRHNIKPIGSSKIVIYRNKAHMILVK